MSSAKPSGTERASSAPLKPNSVTRVASVTAPSLRIRVAIVTTVTLCAIALIFTNLGHYALWDDEAMTALLARGVRNTGDTYAVQGHNILAYVGGAMLRDLHERFQAPLSFYVAAPFVGASGTTSFWPRVPFAIFGLLTVGLMLRWLWRANPPWPVWVMAALAILGNASLFLFCRQARYYAMSMFLSTLLVYLYFHHDRRARTWTAMAVLGVALFCTQYLNFLALAVALLLDWAIFRRNDLRPGWRLTLVLGLPVMAVCGFVGWVWNPIGVYEGLGVHTSLSQRPWLLWMFIRDMNDCELGVGLLMLVAPAVAWRTRQPMLLRAWLGVAVYVVVIALAEQQIVNDDAIAAVRFVSPTIPLCIAIGVMTLVPLSRRWPAVGIALAAVCFWTNLFSDALWCEAGLTSTPAKLLRELASPPPDPYRAASDWINANVTEGQSVLTIPDYSCYSLMYHAPHAVYAWQIKWPPAEQFQSLPLIQFRGRELPDYIVLFGQGAVETYETKLKFADSVRYDVVAALPVFGKDEDRPELIQRSFSALPCNLNEGQGVYILRRVGP